MGLDRAPFLRRVDATLRRVDATWRVALGYSGGLTDSSVGVIAFTRNAGSR